MSWDGILTGLEHLGTFITGIATLGALVFQIHSTRRAHVEVMTAVDGLSDKRADARAGEATAIEYARGAQVAADLKEARRPE